MTTRNQTMHRLRNICCSFINPISSIFKGCLEFLGKYKKQVLAVLFLALEAISTVLDMVGKSRLRFVAAALLLSIIGFGMTVYTCFIERRTRLQAERQLRTVDIVFSIIQLVVVFVHFIMAILGSNNNFSPSVFPLVFAIIAVAFAFQKNEKNSRSGSMLGSNSSSKYTSSHSSSTPNESTSSHSSSIPNEIEDLLHHDYLRADLEANLTSVIGYANNIKSNQIKSN